VKVVVALWWVGGFVYWLASLTRSFVNGSGLLG
jgi:hypothetical protein